METLIFNGSPHIGGDTASLIDKLKMQLGGSFTEVRAYDKDISPCTDCRYCVTHDGCSINDKMQQVYKYIERCDNIIIASPIHFCELSGRLLCVAGRLQTYYCARAFRQSEPVEKPKKGGIILTGGGNGSFERAYKSAVLLLHHMNCYDIYEPVISNNTDKTPAASDTAANDAVGRLAEFLSNKEENE